MKIGKLYTYPKHYAYLYESCVHAEQSAGRRLPDRIGYFSSVAAFNRRVAIGGSHYWSDKISGRVTYIPPGTTFLVLAQSSESFYQVLAGDNCGWIIYAPWITIKEINNGY